jgi:hypothetical protein
MCVFRGVRAMLGYDFVKPISQIASVDFRAVKLIELLFGAQGWEYLHCNYGV